jgi:hypothetical protein
MRRFLSRECIDVTESREVLLTRGQAAKVANVHPSTISKWKKRKQLRTTHDGKYALSDVQRVASAANEIAADIMPVLTQPPTALQNDRRDDEMRQLTIERDALLEERNALRRELELAREQERVWLKQALEAAQERERLLLQLLGKGQEPVDPIHPTPSETVGEGLTQQTGAPIVDQVHTYLKTHPGSHRVKAIQEALGLPKSPKDALGRLARRGAVQRTAIGEYEAKPYEPGPETFLGQILEHVRKVTAEGRTIRA